MNSPWKMKTSVNMALNDRLDEEEGTFLSAGSLAVANFATTVSPPAKEEHRKENRNALSFGAPRHSPHSVRFPPEPRVVAITDCMAAPAIPYLEYESVTFTPFTGNSSYKGSPNPDIDAAWDRIDQAGYVPISKLDLETKLKKNTTYVTLQGSGEMEYLGSLEVYHQLHCLNLIRKYTYEGYYRGLDRVPIPFIDPDDVLRRHIDHCIDYLREAIMCTGDVGVYMSYWVEKRDLPWPDFEVEHKCRRWESIERFAQSAGGTIELPSKPEDAVQYPHPLHPNTN